MTNPLNASCFRVVMAFDIKALKAPKHPCLRMLCLLYLFPFGADEPIANCDQLI